MKKLRNNKIRKLLAFMVALALMVSCMPSAYTISASEAFGDGTEDIFTDGEITSEPAAEESTPDVSSADQEETEQAQQSTLTYENDSVKVTAEALEDGALPQNTALKADSVNENSSVSYDTVSQKLSAAATDKGSSLRGFFAYDVYFADGDGNRVEPNGRVRVTFEYKTPAAPELTDAASTSVTVEKLHYNSSTGDTDVNTLQANEDLKVLNVNEGKQIQTLQVETGNTAVFAVMWDSPETADVEAEAVSGNGDEVPIASEELTDGMDISDEPEQDAAETPAAENPEVTPDAEPSEAPAENPDAEPTEAPAEDPDVVEEPAEDIASPEEVPAADENGETSLIEVLGDDTNLRVSPSVEAEVLATVNAGTQLTLLDTVTAEDGATWYKVSWEGTEAYIRSDMAQVVDSSDEAEEPEDVQEEEIQPEITRYDYTSDEVNVKVTLTDPADLPDNAELSVTPVELSQEAEDQITEEAIKEKKAIEKIHSYDIKFLVDGEEVQPGASVKVSVSLNDEKKINDADVYHVDDENNIENMGGNVDKNGNVEFETTHFSTYVIVDNKRNGKISVTIEHYDGTTNPASKIYANDVRTLTIGQKVDCKKAENWDISKVELVTDNGTSTVEPGEFNVAQDATVKVYYKPVTVNFAGAPTFYDYTVKAEPNYSINQPSNYGKNKDSNNKLTMGEAKQNYQDYGYNWPKDGLSVNTWTGSAAVIKGLLKGLNADGNVEFNYPDPGFFTNSDLLAGSSKDNYLRKIYRDYTLNFERSGDTYTLTGVTDGNGTNVTEQYNLDKNGKSGADFFPLDSVRSSYESAYTKKTDSKLAEDNKIHNYYFGMRYDIKFKLGDYIGPLSYSFTGDDDMWVVLDGKQVVIDLGGIHNAATDSVDLWKYLLNTNQNKTQLTDEQKKAEHTLTILYMERGAGASNCYMNFTIPNAKISQVTTDALGTLTFNKVNKDGTGLSGASFALYTDEDCTTQLETATSVGKTGTVTFDRLRAGTYYLKEIQAPEGYVLSNEKWKVEVTKNGDNVTTTLKDSEGNVVENNQISNQKREAIIDSSMDYDKTATVADWDKRTYNINITASSKSTSSSIIERESVADIMMVFDMSGSMNEDGSIREFGYFKSVEQSLDKTKVYYYNTKAKTASVTGNTYYSNPMIYVDGKWQYYNGSSWQTLSNNSNSMVYTWNSRITALKEAAIAFIKDTASKSPNSKIGITTFDGYIEYIGWNGYYATRGNEIQAITKVGSSPSSMIKAVSKITADGGTSPQKGLEKTKIQLNSVKDDNLSKYIILFTDGAPSESSDTSETETAITSLKKDATIFTVALTAQSETVPGSNKNNIEWMKDLATDEDHAFTASDASNIGIIFQKIQETITDNIDITNATITDVIDPRFEIVNNDKVITNEDLEKGAITLANGGVVSLDENGNQVVTWSQQTIHNVANGKPWSQTITVRAKDEYIGGNNVTTNVSPASKISTGYGDVELPQPRVNVKSDLIVSNNETTIFYGDKVPTSAEILNKLFDTSAPQGYVKQLDGTKKLVTYTKGADGETISQDDFTLEWYKDEACTEKISVEEMGNDKPAPDSKRYYLKVTYNKLNNDLKSVTSSDKCTKNTNGKISGDNGSGKLTAYNSQDTDKNDQEKRWYGIYTINIIPGQIQITKTLESEAEKDETFTFDIKKDNVKIATATAIVEKGATEATVTFTTEKDTTSKVDTETPALTNLERGEYTVTENVNSSYTLKEATVGTETNCRSNISQAKEITFNIGTDKDGKEVLKDGNTDTTNGKIGVAKFTNEKSVADVEFEKVDKVDETKIKGAKFALYKADETTWNKVSDTPVEGYDSITSGDNGKFKLQNLPVGKYLLYEIEAATGYICPTEPWKITVGNGGTVTVTDSKDESVGSIVEGKITIYRITNTKVYSLPSAGGPGIYGFTISGVAILATALLLFINNKRREEEAERS